WRCYARETLSSDGKKYARGTTYCTRHHQLLHLIRSCHEREALSSPDASAVCISETGDPTPCDLAQPSLLPVDLTGVDFQPDPSEASRQSARVEEWLFQCSRGRHCSCLVHGVSHWSFRLFSRLPTVAFFVLPYDATLADRLVHLATSRGWRHVHVLTAELQTRAPKPMQNALLNPTLARLRALQSLQLSNEFFDFQLLHTSAGPGWLCAPSLGDARSLLSLSALTLLILPQAECSARWRGAYAAASTPASTQSDPIRAAAHINPAVVGAGCLRGERPADSSEVGWPKVRSQCEVLLRLRSLRRLNAHHFSCSQQPPMHRRMYVMDLPLDEPAEEGIPPANAPIAANSTSGGEAEMERVQAEARERADALDATISRARASIKAPRWTEWHRRVPSLFRIQEEKKFGSPADPFEFSDLATAWSMRGKDLRFDTGGVNVDTLLHLQLHPLLRLPLLEQFLSLPIGRDMMLWNIIAGAGGLYAIDQEGMFFADREVPWKQRMMPYCLSVQ
ncbi:MAG: hypothetical protein SGPRY_012172, partial [Prymnesium sp.]